MSEPTASEWADIRAQLRQLVETVNRMESRLEHVVLLDKTVDGLRIRLEAAENNVKSLWDKHADQQKRWTHHDLAANDRMDGQNKHIAKLIEPAVSVAQSADSKIEALINRFRGVGYVWMVIGGVLTGGVAWVVNEVNHLTKQVAVLEYRVQGQKP